MSHKAEMHFDFDGALEAATPDQHDARLAFSSNLNAVLEEIQTWPTIDLNQISLEAQLHHIEPVNGTTRGHYIFSFVAHVQLSDTLTDLHDARQALAELEKAIVDEVGNWPTTEIRKLSVSARLES